MYTGEQTVNPNSIETNQGLFLSLHANHHNANKQIWGLNTNVKFKVNQAPHK